MLQNTGYVHLWGTYFTFNSMPYSRRCYLYFTDEKNEAQRQHFSRIFQSSKMMNLDLDSSTNPAWLSHWWMVSVWKVPRICYLDESMTVGLRTKCWALTHTWLSYLCGCLTSSAVFLPFHSKWRKIKDCGAYNRSLHYSLITFHVP